MIEMIEIIPAIIPSKFEEIQEKMEALKGVANKVQIDFVDGKYAPTLTWGFNNEEKKEFPFKDEFVIQVDLMVHNPEDYLADFIKMGAKEFIIHLDSTNYLDKCITIIKNANLKIGLGLKPSLSLPLEGIIYQFDFIQFMGSDRVGYNGVELDPRVPEKIYRFHLQHLKIPIQLDIGVTEKNAPELRRSGVSALVSGSAVFAGKNIKKNFEKLNAAANS